MVRGFFSIVAIVLAGGIFFFYTKPAYDTVQALSAQSAQYDAALSKATQLQSIKQTLLSRYNSFDPNALTRLSTMLPDQVDNIRLILDLDNIAARYGMSLQDVNISAPESESADSSVVGAITSASQAYDSLTLQFTTHGTYAEFKQFLTDLESSLRLVDLVSLTISPGSAGTSTSDQPYTYTMTLQTYWLR